MRGKNQYQSFEDYTNNTHDAWLEDDDDDMGRIEQNMGGVIVQEPTVKVITSGDVRTGLLSRIKKKSHHSMFT